MRNCFLLISSFLTREECFQYESAPNFLKTTLFFKIVEHCNIIRVSSETTWTQTFIHHSKIVYCYDFPIALLARSPICLPPNLIPSVEFNQLICWSEMITDLTFDRNNAFVCHAVRASLLISQWSYSVHSVNKLGWSAVAAAPPSPLPPRRVPRPQQTKHLGK